jgi:hypothetical protein
MIYTCRECGTELPSGHDYCSPGCLAMAAEDARPAWTPETAETAAAAVVVVRDDPTRCRACGKRLPEPTGRRGRPRKTCDADCARRAKAGMETARTLHDRARFTTDPAAIGRGAAYGSLIAEGDLDRFSRDGGTDERRLFGDARPVARITGVTSTKTLRASAEIDRTERALENMERRRAARRARLSPEVRAMLDGLAEAR